MSELSSPLQLNAIVSKPPRLNASLSSPQTLNAGIQRGSIGQTHVYYDTTEHWDSQPLLISERGAVYIYSDHAKVEKDGLVQNIPALRIGDGTTYLIDLPFANDDSAQMIVEHVADVMAHASSEDRIRWDNKISSYLLAEDPENLVLSKTNFILEGDVFYA